MLVGAVESPHPMANARSDAMTMSARVRGIARTNQIETARIANAMEIEIAERKGIRRSDY